MLRIIGMDEIEKHYSPGYSRHWFDKDTLRFFKSRLPQQAYQTDDETRAYFVTSEQPPDGSRRWSIRCYSFVTRDIETIGPFCSWSSSRAATSAAMKLAKFNSATPAKAA